MLSILRRLVRAALLDPIRSIVPDRHKLGYDLLLQRLTGRLEDELLVLDRIVEGREVALDVGANQGYYSYVLSRSFGRVEAFEPNPSLAAELARYVGGNVTVHNVALSSSEGTLDLFVPRVGGVEYHGWASFDPQNLPGASDFRVCAVPVRPLDSYDFPTVSFLKVDVEGHEPDVIRGAMETLRRHRPVVLVEVKERNREAVFAAFRSLGYAPYRLHRGALLPLAEGADPGGAGENFVFRPAERVGRRV